MSQVSTPRQHLLHVEASPRGQRSASIEVAHAFVRAWQDRHPDGTTDVPLPQGQPGAAQRADVEFRHSLPAEAPDRRYLSQKDVLFSFDERGLNGLLGGRRAVVVNSRGVGLGPDFPREELDHQQSYMTTWLRMIGITDISHIGVEKTLMGAEIDHAARAEACAQAARLGATD